MNKNYYEELVDKLMLDIVVDKVSEDKRELILDRLTNLPIDKKEFMLNLDLTTNRLTRIKHSHIDRHGNKCSYYKCDCSNTKICVDSYVRNKHTKSCGCLGKDSILYNALKQKIKEEINDLNFIGTKVNKLTIIKYSHSTESHNRVYLCLCDCGKEVLLKKALLKDNKQTSCGCIGKLKLIERNKKRNKDTALTQFENKKSYFTLKEDYSLNAQSFIYKLTNLINGKIYIGKTESNLKKLLRRYSYYAIKKEKTPKRYIDRALYKYNLSDFMFEIIEFCKKPTINDKEICYIKVLNCQDPKIGYNVTSGGEGSPGHACSLETRIKISQSKLGTVPYNKGVSRVDRKEFKVLFNSKAHYHEICSKLKISEGLYYKLRKELITNHELEL